jgi:hypothetical protein
VRPAAAQETWLWFVYTQVIHHILYSIFNVQCTIYCITYNI